VHTDDVWEVHDAFFDVSILGVRRQDNVVAGRDYTEPPAGYYRTDVSVGGVLELSEHMLARVTLSCTNLFNAAYRDYLSQYRYFTDDPGRNIILRFTTSF
jgi:iron complex outermembrane receptor protein